MMVTFHTLPNNPSFDELFCSAPFLLSTDWFGQALAAPVEIFFGGNPEWILFGGRGGWSPWCAPAQPGDFIEGLWERDVVELFLGEPGSPRYQEFNLSPRGAWWTMAFSGYRTRMVTKPLPGVRCHAESVGKEWRAAIAIPRVELTIAWSSGSGTANLTAVQGNPQRFVTALDLGGGEPDFHRAEQFQSVWVVG